MIPGRSGRQDAPQLSHEGKGLSPPLSNSYLKTEIVIKLKV